MMMSPGILPRRLLRGVRSGVEGLRYRWSGRSGRHPSGYAALRKREGLAPLRRAYWTAYTLEPRQGFLRQVRSMEEALTCPPREPGREILPANGRLLVLRLNHLGDLLHVLPTVAELRRQRPDLRVDLVTGPWNRGLKPERWFDHVTWYTPDLVQYHRGNRAKVASPAEERRLLASLGEPPVDVVLCPTVPSLAELPLMYGARPARYVGGEIPVPDLPPPGDSRTLVRDSRRYEAEAVGDVLPLLGLERPSVMALTYAPDPESRRRVEAWLGSTTDPPLVAIAPGSGWPGKSWPPERFAAVADTLIRSFGATCVLLGSGSEADLCREVCGAMQEQARIGAGDLTVDEAAALLARADLLIGNDSLPVHLGAAVGCPTVSLWGPTFPEAWAPRGAEHRAVKAPGPCAGCTYWHPAASCNGTPPCMRTLGVEPVIHAARELLARRVSRQPVALPAEGGSL